MVNDEPQHDNNQEGELVELIPLKPLIEDPDPDFDVVITERSQFFPSLFKRRRDKSRPAAPKPESEQT